TLDQFLQLDRAAPLLSLPPSLLLCLSGGDRIGGAPVKLASEQLVFRSATLGELTFPLNQLSAIVRPGQILPSKDERGTEDVIRLSNGDSVRGIISDITAEAITIQPTGGEAVRVPIGS